MPTVLTHPVVPLAMAIGLGRGVISRRLLVAGVVVSILPDLDVLAFRFGIPYADQWSHRGFSHSFMFALIVAAIGAGLARLLVSTPGKTFWFLLVAAASHGILDAFTNGGFGIAFLWPFSQERFFAPIHPIEVAPLSLSRFLSSRGIAVLSSEILWVWLPCLSAAAIAVALHRRRLQSLRSIADRR